MKRLGARHSQVDLGFRDEDGQRQSLTVEEIATLGEAKAHGRDS
jgi:hypothetical protein